MDVKNGMFWSEIGSGFGEPGGTPLPRIPRSHPPDRERPLVCRDRDQFAKRPVISTD